MSGIAKEDFDDLDVVDAVELGSSGSASDEYQTNSVTSVVSGVVTVTGTALWTKDTPVQSNDIFVLSGASAGNGSYTVASVTSATTFTVNESIVDSTGGSASFRHPAGSEKVGVDPTNITFSTATDLQQMLEDIAAEVAAGGITEGQHKTLRQLIHFIGTNSPGDGFAAGPYVSEISDPGPFPSAETWYTDSGKTVKICREEVTYNSNKTLATQTWIVYKSDGTNPAAKAVDDPIAYSGVFETGRTRTFTLYA